MFANKVVLVTGGSAGIGAATVVLFAKEGAAVAFVGRNEEKLKDVAKRCEEYGAKVLPIKADISKQDEAQTIVKQTVDKFGKLDVLVNNAGIVRFGPVTAPDVLEIYDTIMNTNLRAVVQITSLAIPHLIETKGNIINISSVAAMSSKIPGITPYSMSKAAMDSYTKGAANELAQYGIRVNSINPGPVATDILRSSDKPTELPSIESMSDITVLGKMAHVDEIGDLILYVASDKAKSITGSCLVIDNGTLLK